MVHMLFTQSLVSRTSRQVTALHRSLRNPLQRPAMSSSSAPLREWLVIIPDHAGALEKRLVARPKHLEGLKSDREDMWLWGGAMLEEPIQPGSTDPPKMKGSALLIGANTEEEVLERVKKDVYVGEGVWDVSKIKIIPFKSALRKAL